MRFDGFSVRKPLGKKHRDLSLVAAVLFTELGDKKYSEKKEGSPADDDGKSHYRLCGIRFHGHIGRLLLFRDDPALCI